MADFKLENNVPNYYVSESRDFQLLCRVIDIYLKGCLVKANYIPYQLDLDKCDEQLLYAVANMQGFTTKKYIPPNILRNILKVFPYCIKRKGTKEAIELAARAILSTDRLIYYINVEVFNNVNDPTNKFIIEITCNAQSEYRQYLGELLSFLVPPGWQIRYQLKNTFTEDINAIVATTNSKVARLSGITGKIVSIYPLLVNEFDTSVTSVVKNGMYSRVGFAKILQSRNRNELETQVGYVENNNFTNLLDSNAVSTGQTVFIGNNVELQDKT